jgi:recombination protein RecA
MPKATKVSKTGTLGASILSTLKGAFGDAVVTTRGDEALGHVAGYLSTQCVAIDHIIGHPGIPYSRFTTIRGREAAGKTTIATHLLAECQKRGGLPIYIDSEYAFDAKHAAALGLFDADELENQGIEGREPLMIIQPEHLEGTFEIIEKIIKGLRERSKDMECVIVWDSVAGTPAAAQLKGNYEDIQPGIHARRISAALRKIVRLIAEKKVALVFIGQLKSKIGQAGPRGGSDTMIGERPIGFHSSVILDVVRVSFVGKKKALASAIVTKVTCYKNKTAPPFRECTINIGFKHGIDNDASILEMALERKIIRKSGGYMSMKGDDEKWRAAIWPDVACYDEVGKRLRIKLAQEQREDYEEWQEGETAKRDSLLVDDDEEEDEDDTQDEEDEDDDDGEAEEEDEDEAEEDEALSASRPAKKGKRRG